MARSPAPAPRQGDPTETLSVYRYGRFDPTTVLDRGEFWRATFTPDGPGTVHLDWRSGELRAEAWGDGGRWLLATVPALVGDHDPGFVFTAADPIVLRAQRNHPDVRFGASGTLYHGPLLLPPEPSALVGHPSWWFHQLGVETKRSEALRTVARHADKLFGWALLPKPAERLALLPGVGEWTIGSVLPHALGDPDAVAVGDFHLKNVINFAFTGRARGTDAEMLGLLQPYAGQRGRVVRLLLLDGHRAPKFGPRQRVVPLTGS